MKTIPPATALKHVYHAVYAQIWCGFFFAIVIPTATQRTEWAGADVRGLGAVALFSGINIYAYLRRYERALATSRTATPDLA